MDENGNKQPKTPVKFALSVMVLGASALVFCAVSHFRHGDAIVIFALVILDVLLQLLISPISLSLATKSRLLILKRKWWH